VQLLYLWTLPPERHAHVRGLFPRGELYGGDRIGPLAALPDYQQECRHYAENAWLSEPEFQQTQEEWLRAVPFLRMDNGDMLALDPARAEADPPVIYLDHENTSRLIARNLGAFLRDWERLCFLGPDHYVLGEFCDPASGALDPETARAQRLRDVFSQPFRPTVIELDWLAWKNASVVKIAQRIHQRRAFADLPILADALEEAGCTSADILGHLRGPEPHVRSCWVIDLILGKE
jgi:hypothetical protein